MTSTQSDPLSPIPSQASAPNQGGSRPAPDPTILTTEQLLRGISNLKEFIEAKIDGLEEKYEVRFDSIDDQFDVIERYRIEQKADTQKAVDAALLAAKEAVKEQTLAQKEANNKSETAFSEQSKLQYATLQEALKGQQTIISDIKDRVVKIESAQLSAKDTRAETRTEYRDTRSDSQAGLGTILSVAALILVVIGMFVTVALNLANN